MQQLKHFIGSEYTGSASGEVADIIDPVTGRPYCTAAVAGPEDVDRALRVAAAAFEQWREATPARRPLALLKIADAVEARADGLVLVESANPGKPIALTAAEELPMIVDQLRFFAGAARVLEGRSAGEYMEGHTSFVRREPIGVCAQVTPWNYPLLMAVWKIAPVLAAGNTVVAKPADTTPASTLLFAEICAEFLPPGVLNVICGDRDTGRALVEHEIPAMVSITGSVRAGIGVTASAAKDVKRVHLELGGKAPVVVFADADIEAAAEGIAAAGYFNAGQDCTAATRVLVDGFVDRLPSHATVHCGGKRYGDESYFYAPTVISGVRLRLRVDQHAYSAGRRNAARRLQEVRLRQGSLALRLRGLQPRQARDERAVTTTERHAMPQRAHPVSVEREQGTFGWRPCRSGS